MQRKTGEEAFSAFVPDPLPPREPPLVLDERMRDLLRDAEQKLTRLDLAGEMVPSLEWVSEASAAVKRWPPSGLAADFGTSVWSTSPVTNRKKESRGSSRMSAQA